MLDELCKDSVKEILHTVKTVKYEDIKELDDFRVPNYKLPKIDWDRTGEGVPVHQLPNIFDEDYDKLIK